MQRRRQPLATLLLLCALLCAACGRSRSSRAVLPTSAPIVIGFSYTGSGPAAAGCRGVRDGYQLWSDTVNRAGGIVIGGRRFSVSLIGYDDGGSALQAAVNAERLLTQDGAALLLGPCGGAPTAAVATVVERYGRLLVVTAPYADATLARGYRFVVDVAATTTNAADTAATYLAALSPRPRLAVLWSGSQPAQLLGAAIVASAGKNGLTVDPIGAYPPGTTDLSAQVARLRSGADTAALIVGQPAEAVALRSALATSAGSAVAFVAAPVGGDDLAATAFGQAGTGVALLLPWSPLDAATNEPLFGSYAHFAAAFSAASGYQPGSLATLAVAGGELAGEAISGAQSLDGGALRAWFAHGGHVATVAGALTIAIASGVASVQSLSNAVPPPARGAATPASRDTPSATPALRASPHP